jgi:alkanesulfonate monooxygenase SsuD/methylene tetrahydromethanopterin reductase-like flavin-dependent oxidoreductase (luciferase family)
MAGGRVKFGLTLPNRGVVIGATTVAQMLQLAADAESSGWDSVWVGDSIFAKPRLDAMVLMGAIAARTTRVRIGPACFASTPLRNALVLAYQWASLDFLSGGRTVFVACQAQPEPGGGAFEKEFAHFGIEAFQHDAPHGGGDRDTAAHLVPRDIDYDGQYWRFRNLTVLPRPIQQPIPIWVTANPDLNKRRNVEQSYRRVARLGDGWMTTFKLSEDVQTSLAMIRGYSRETGHDLKPDFEVAIYHNINVNEDPDEAFAESKRFLEAITRSITARTCCGSG